MNNEKPKCRYCGDEYHEVPRHPKDPRGTAFIPTCSCHETITIGDLRSFLEKLTSDALKPDFK